MIKIHLGSGPSYALWSYGTVFGLVINTNAIVHFSFTVYGTKDFMMKCTSWIDSVWSDLLTKPRSSGQSRFCPSNSTQTCLGVMEPSIARSVL